MNIILNVLVVTVSVAVASSRGYNPCKDYTHGSHNYLLKDPLDCSRYYSCNGQIGYHMHCAAGTSFDQGFQHGYGSCTGPDPSRVPDCYRQRRSEIQSKIHNSSFYSEYFLIHVGHYGPWSYWSSCSKTCGSGIRTRSRTCIKKDNFHTYFCNGPSEDREQCYMEECKGTLGQWSHWSGCSATCGSGKHRRTRKCIGPGHCRGLGSLTEIKDCRNLPSCQGKFGKWSPWSPCSATCGEATRQRRRECNGPGDCLGHLEEEEDCLYLPSCKGTLGQWTDWSRCSVTCGKGFQRRTRKCNGPGDCEGLGILEEKATCPELPKCQGKNPQKVIILLCTYNSQHRNLWRMD